jgi:hypothetical protein
MDILQQIEIAVGLKFGFAFVFGNLILVTGIKPNDIRLQRFDGRIGVKPDGGIQYRPAKFVAIGRDIGPSAGKTNSQGSSGAYQHPVSFGVPVAIVYPRLKTAVT